MIERLRELELRRTVLVERSCAQRAAIAASAAPFARVLGAIDVIVRLVGWATRAAAAYSLLRRI